VRCAVVYRWQFSWRLVLLLTYCIDCAVMETILSRAMWPVTDLAIAVFVLYKKHMT